MLSNPAQGLYIRVGPKHLLRATSHARLRAHDHPTPSTLIGGKGRGGPNKFRFTLCLRDQRSMWMQDGCKVYMASNGSCFMVTCILFQKPPLCHSMRRVEVCCLCVTYYVLVLFVSGGWYLSCSDTQSLFTRHLRGRSNTKPWDHGTPNVHNRCYILFYHVRGPPHEIKIIEIAFDWGPGHIWLHTTPKYPWAHYKILGRPLDPFVWALTIMDITWARVWIGPQPT